MAKKSASPLRTLALDGDLDVFSVQMQWEKAQAFLASATGPVELDLSAVGDLDLSGVQLLCALERDLQTKGVEFAVRGSKDEWKSRYTPMGLAHLFTGGSS